MEVEDRERPSVVAPQFRALIRLGWWSGDPGLQSRAVPPAFMTRSSCFDSLGQAGRIGWSAVRSAPCTVQVLWGRTAHVTLQLPEPVLAVQLGTAARAVAAAPGQRSEVVAAEQWPTVLVAVGESGCAWAWELWPELAAAGRGPSSGVGAGQGERQLGSGGSCGQGAAGWGRGKREVPACPAGSLYEGLQGSELEEGGTQSFPVGPARAPAGCGEGPWLPPTSISTTGAPPQLQLQTRTLQQRMPLGGDWLGPEGALQLAQASLAAAPVVHGVAEAGGRAQLAAQVVWEYLDALAQTGKALASSPAGSPGPLPIPLSGLPAASRPAVLHSISTWAASPHLPPDACSACYVAMPGPASSWRVHRGCTRRALAAGGGGRVGGGCRSPGEGIADALDWQAAGASGGGPLGHLLVGTSSGRVEAFPVGTPLKACDVPAAIARCSASHAVPGGRAQLLAVQHGSQLLPMWLPAGQAVALSPPQRMPLRLMLHAASGRVALSPAGHGSIQLRVAGGQAGGGLISGQGAAAPGPLFAVLGVSGDVDCICVQGHVLYYTTAGKLYGLNCSGLLQHASRPSSGAEGVQPEAVHIPTPAPVLLVAAPTPDLLQPPPAAASTGPATVEGQDLLLLTHGGTLLRMLLPAGGWGPAPGMGEGLAGFRQLEGEMQDLLGRVAHLSAIQEAQASTLRHLDARIAHIAAAIPAVQSINTSSGGGVHCWVRPLYCLAQVLGAGGREGLAAEVHLANGGCWTLPACLSLVVSLAVPPSPGSSTAGHSIAHSVPLPALPPGAAHTVTCFLAAPGLAGRCQGVLHVLLCHHRATQGLAPAALLHSMRLDPLHLHSPSAPPSLGLPPPSGTLHFPGQGRGASRGGPIVQQPVVAHLRLEIPTRLFGRRPEVGRTLRAVLGQGLSSLDLSPPPPTAAAAMHRSSGSSAGEARLPGRADASGSCELAQCEREGRRERQRRLVAMQLGPGAALCGPGVEPPQDWERAGAGNWWEGLLHQQRQAHRVRPTMAFSLLPPAPEVAPGHVSGAPGGAQPCIAADFPASGLQQAAVHVWARCVPGRGPRAGASWQHAELELTASAGAVAAALEAHAALARRALALQDSLPDQELPSCLRLGPAALLAPQAEPTSVLQSVVEGADSGELEAVLCTLRQLKGRAVLLRDEALRAQEQAVGAKAGGGAAGQRQGGGVQLRRGLAALALAVVQQVGRVPVIVASHGDEVLCPGISTCGAVLG